MIAICYQAASTDQDMRSDCYRLLAINVSGTYTRIITNYYPPELILKLLYSPPNICPPNLERHIKLSPI